MDLQRRRQLVENIEQQGFPEGSTPAPIVSLEEFFSGNDDIGFIGCNTHNGGPTFFEPLRAIRNRSDVQDVLIEIYEVEDNRWPFSERVYVLTSAHREEVMQWFSDLEASTGEEQDYVYGTPEAAPPLEQGIKIYAVWWD